MADQKSWWERYLERSKAARPEDRSRAPKRQGDGGDWQGGPPGTPRSGTESPVFRSYRDQAQRVASGVPRQHQPGDIFSSYRQRAQQAAEGEPERTRGRDSRFRQVDEGQRYLDRIRESRELRAPLGQIQVKELTQEEYEALNPAQRAAIDANTELWRASEEDRALRERTPYARGDKQYEQRVSRLFGERGGSELYAPNTLAVLEKLGIRKRNADLDDYLDYSGLVLDDDLGALADGAPETKDTRSENARLFSNAAMLRLSGVLEKGRTLLDASKVATTADLEPGVGFGNTDTDRNLNAIFESMASRSFNRSSEEVMAGLTDFVAQTPGLSLDDVFGYFDKRLRASEYAAGTGRGAPLGSGFDVDYLTPEEFRAKFFRMEG